MLPSWVNLFALFSKERNNNERYCAWVWAMHSFTGRSSKYCTPVYDSRIKEDLWKVIDFGLRGNCQGSVVDGSGKNCLWTTDTEESFRSQEELYKYYKSHITND